MNCRVDTPSPGLTSFVFPSTHFNGSGKLEWSFAPGGSEAESTSTYANEFGNIWQSNSVTSMTFRTQFTNNIGTSTVSNTTLVLSAIGRDFTIPLDTPQDISIHEILIYNRVLGDDELVALRNYLYI